MSEAVLDAILTEAASMSGELSADVGKLEPIAADDPSASADTPAGAVDDLDAQLSNMEELLGSTAADLGTQPADEQNALDSATSATVESAPANESTADIPAFMDEFTQPESEANENAPGSTPNEAKQAPVPPGPDGNEAPSFMDEFTQPDPGDAPSAPSPDKQEPADVANAAPGIVRSGVVGGRVESAPPLPAGQPSTPDTGESREAGGTAAGVSRPSSSIGRRLAPIATAACERGASLLECMDKPTSRVPVGVRQILGWIALATLGTSLLLLLASFLL